MADTFTQIYIHIIFAVSGRVNLLHDAIRDEVCRYITGIVQNQRHKMIAIGGRPDHLHFLTGMRPDVAVSGLVHDVKIASTRFMNGKNWFGGGYAWQNGFGAFSCSRSHLDRVARYILNQAARHAKTTFRQEYLALLKRYDVSFEEKYLFDFMDR